MKYSTVLLDFDHTLFDFDGSEAAAFSQTMAAFDIDDPGDHLDTFHHINRSLWRDVELGKTSPRTVHTARFEQLNKAIGRDGDSQAMAVTFATGLGANGELYEGATAVLESLAEQAPMAMITNGLSVVQRARIERLDIGRFFDSIVISEEVGVTKPRREIFEIAFEQLGHPPKQDALMVGDSLNSDINGGTNYGIATCWYNPHDHTADASHQVTHEIRTLEELPPLIRGS